MLVVLSICCQYFQILGRLPQVSALLALLKFLTSLIFSESSLGQNLEHHCHQKLHSPHFRYCGLLAKFVFHCIFVACFRLIPLPHHELARLDGRPPTQSNTQNVSVVPATLWANCLHPRATGYHFCIWVWQKCTWLWVRSVTPFSSAHGILCIRVGSGGGCVREEGWGQEVHHLSPGPNACPGETWTPWVSNGYF